MVVGPRFMGWLQKVDNIHSARSSYCCKTFDIGNMGKSALRSHMKGKKHCERAPSSNSQSFFNHSSNSSTTVSSSASSSTTPSSNNVGLVDSMIINTSTVHAEIRWALKVVLSKFSRRSCDDIAELFATMFPDSCIAKSMSCAITKIRYMITFGLSPYFHECLRNELKVSPYHVISYDESFNRVLHFGQMDFLIRYWNVSKKLVETRYLISEFLQGANAEQPLGKFDDAVASLDQSKLIQISPDGPNVNLKVLKIISDQREEGNHLPLIDIGTCGLHTVHRSLQNGIVSSGWKVEYILNWMWNLLKESPARREVYERITKADVYPLPYCKTRWCESEQTAERAAEIWSNYQKFSKHLMSLPKSKQSKNNKSYDGLVSVISDTLICVKFKFVEMLSWKFNKFLRGFQTDYPMVPFLYSALEDLLRWLMERFVLEETLAKADSGRKRLKINPQDVNIRKPADYVDVGSAAELLISEYNKKSTYKESTVLNFRKEVSVLLATLTSHFMEKSPIKSAVVRFVICFDPNYMANS